MVFLVNFLSLSEIASGMFMPLSWTEPWNCLLTKAGMGRRWSLYINRQGWPTLPNPSKTSLTMASQPESARSKRPQVTSQEKSFSRDLAAARLVKKDLLGPFPPCPPFRRISSSRSSFQRAQGKAQKGASAKPRKPETRRVASFSLDTP